MINFKHKILTTTSIVALTLSLGHQVMAADTDITDAQGDVDTNTLGSTNIDNGGSATGVTLNNATQASNDLEVGTAGSIGGNGITISADSQRITLSGNVTGNISWTGNFRLANGLTISGITFSANVDASASSTGFILTLSNGGVMGGNNTLSDGDDIVTISDSGTIPANLDGGAGTDYIYLEGDATVATADGNTTNFSGIYLGEGVTFTISHDWGTDINENSASPNTPQYIYMNGGTVTAAINTGGGNDKIYFQPGTTVNGNVDGGSGDDILIYQGGAIGATAINGGSGNDTFTVADAISNTFTSNITNVEILATGNGVNVVFSGSGGNFQDIQGGSATEVIDVRVNVAKTFNVSAGAGDNDDIRVTADSGTNNYGGNWDGGPGSGDKLTWTVPPSVRLGIGVTDQTTKIENMSDICFVGDDNGQFVILKLDNLEVDSGTDFDVQGVPTFEVNTSQAGSFNNNIALDADTDNVNFTGTGAATVGGVWTPAGPVAVSIGTESDVTASGLSITNVSSMAVSTNGRWVLVDETSVASAVANTSFSSVSGSNITVKGDSEITGFGAVNAADLEAWVGPSSDSATLSATDANGGSGNITVSNLTIKIDLNADAGVHTILDTTNGAVSVTDYTIPSSVLFSASFAVDGGTGDGRVTISKTATSSLDIISTLRDVADNFDSLVALASGQLKADINAIANDSSVSVSSLEDGLRKFSGADTQKSSHDTIMQLADSISNSIDEQTLKEDFFSLEILEPLRPSARPDNFNVLNPPEETVEQIPFGDEVITKNTSIRIPQRETRFWAKAFGGFGDQSARKGDRGFDQYFAGFSAGTHTTYHKNKLLGFAVTYAYSNVDYDIAGPTETEVHSFGLTGYGRYDWDKWFLDGKVGFTINDYESTRETPALAIAKGDFNGHQLWTDWGVGYKFKTESGINITPKAKVKLSHLEIERFTETGAGAANLTQDFDGLTTLKVGADVNVSYPIVRESGVWLPSLKAGVAYDVLDPTTETRVNFNVGNPFNVEGTEPARFKFNVGAGVEWKKDQWSVSADYTLDGKEDYIGHTLEAKVTYRF